MRMRSADIEKLLEEYDENGKRARVGNWSIGKGGYDLWFEIYYKEQPVLQCIDGDIETDFSSELTKDEVKKLEKIVRKWMR